MPSSARNTCKICAHPQRAAIEKALADPARSNRSVAIAYKICARTLDRHKLNCTRLAVTRAIERQERAIGVDLVDRVERLQSVTEHIMETALRGVPLLDRTGNVVLDKGKQVLVSDAALALKAISQARHNYRLIAQLTGKLTPADEGATQSVTFEQFVLIYQAAQVKP
jgi:hypothetical protein